MILGVDPKVDYAFRKLFASQANSDLLVDLLGAVLNPPPDQRIVSAEILTPFNEKDTEDDKETILDIKARDQLGRQYNVEMEMSPTGTFPARLLYYWAVLHASQLAVGDDYEKLKPTISICFADGVLFPQVPDFHLDFQLRSARHPELIFLRHQEVHTVELRKFVKKVDELVDPLDVWCYFLKHGEGLDLENLPAPFTKVAVPRALEVLKMLKQSELEWHRYQSQLRATRDRAANEKERRKEALAEGRAEGLAEGRSEGLAKGELIGRIHAYQGVLKRTLTPHGELLALALDALEAKAAALETELAQRITT